MEYIQCLLYRDNSYHLHQFHNDLPEKTLTRPKPHGTIFPPLNQKAVFDPYTLHGRELLMKLIFPNNRITILPLPSARSNIPMTPIRFIINFNNRFTRRSNNASRIEL